MKGNLVQTSFEILDAECVQPEVRSAKDVVYEIIEICKRLSHRWEKKEEHMRWESNGCMGDEPKFMDKDTREIKSSRYALSPCKLVNTELDSLVDIVLQYYSSEKLNNVMNIVTTDDAIARSIHQIRQISIHSEEAMEQEALELIFKMVEKNPKTYKDMVMDFAKRSCRNDEEDGDDDGDDHYNLKHITLIDDVTYRFLTRMQILMNAVSNKTTNELLCRNNATNEFLCRDQQKRIAMLHVLVVDLIKHLQEIHPFVYKGMVFKYFGNYLSLVVGELQLLTTPLMLHENTEKEGDCLVALAGEVPDLILSSQSGSKACSYRTCKSGCKEVRHHISASDLSSKTFTFVGAGFPLTGVLLHILTGGAKINLVDCDPNVVKNAKLFVEITESLQITDVGAITIIHAYGEDVIYRPTAAKGTPSAVKRSASKAENLCPGQFTNSHTRGSESLPTECNVLSDDPTENCSNDNQMMVVPTDILDIASAIPQEVTRQILRDNAMEVGVVRKRNTRGMSEIMYEKFTLESTPCRFELAMEVAPPQKVVSGASPEYLVAGVLSTMNINSCQLYLNSELIRNAINDMNLNVLR